MRQIRAEEENSNDCLHRYMNRAKHNDDRIWDNIFHSDDNVLHETVALANRSPHIEIHVWNAKRVVEHRPRHLLKDTVMWMSCSTRLRTRLHSSDRVWSTPYHRRWRNIGESMATLHFSTNFFEFLSIHTNQHYLYINKSDHVVLRKEEWSWGRTWREYKNLKSYF